MVADGGQGTVQRKAWEVWCLEGTDTVKWPDLGETLVLPWMGAQPRHRQDLAVYINGTPRGDISYPQGMIVWTDGSVRKVKDEVKSGAGWIDSEGVKGKRRVWGEATIMRAEMAAGAMAVITTPRDMPLTVFTDSLSLLWVIRR